MDNQNEPEENGESALRQLFKNSDAEEGNHLGNSGWDKTAKDKIKIMGQLYDRSNASSQTKPSGLYYDVDDNPPIHLATLFGFQIAMCNIFSCVNMAVIIAEFICSDQEFAASLYCTTTVMCGVSTILQTSLGSRLPIFQGPSILSILIFINAANDPAWGCRTSDITEANISVSANKSVLTAEKPWMAQWGKVHGSVMVASGIEILVGSLGLGGLLLRLMGPLSITCLILLLGISAQGFISTLAEVHWGVSCINIVIIIILSQYVNRCNVPMPTWSRRGGFKFVPFPLYELFPVLLSVLFGWIISFIFTVCGVFPEDRRMLQYQARTDFAAESIRQAPVFRFPYPGQYGAPAIKISYVVTLTVAIFGSMLESIGDYVQTSVQSRVPVPPPHAINRGLMVEGLGSLLSGVMGAGHVTTSFSNMIGIIGITKVASRRAFVISGVFLVLMGICGKLGAVFVAIPKPVLAGPVFISIALLVGAALSNLKEVDLWSARTQGVLGIAIMAGTVFPNWIQQHPGTFNTGSPEADSTLVAFLGTPLVVGVIVAIFLDTTVPGTSRKKQPTALAMVDVGDDSVKRDVTFGQTVSQDPSIYNIPLAGRLLSTCRLSRYVPFLPDPSGPVDRLKPIPSVNVDENIEIKL